MNNDIIPKKPNETGQLPQIRLEPEAPQARPLSPKQLTELPKPEEFYPSETPASTEKPRRRGLKWILVGMMAIVLLVLAGLGAAYWFLLSPKDRLATELIPVEIVSGMLPGEIADELEEAGVIRSSFIFGIYTRFHGAQDPLQAGNYQLSPADSTPEVAAQLRSGPAVDEIEVMFKPGATLADNKKVLLTLGYSADEIDAAFTAEYDHPLFAGRPDGSDIEGYVFGETHRFIKGTPVKAILERYFDDYFSVITDNDLAALYDKQGLSLYEGITLASIVQRESGGDDKAQIAQVFLLRLSSGIELGSDVTYQYIADKEGNPRDINYDSPYNTRRYPGLPPGPIASPGTAALIAVASPADGDYLYFLSGDDNVTYFARTLGEHEANIRDHCREKCNII